MTQLNKQTNEHYLIVIKSATLRLSYLRRYDKKTQPMQYDVIQRTLLDGLWIYDDAWSFQRRLWMTNTRNKQDKSKSTINISKCAGQQTTMLPNKMLADNYIGSRHIVATKLRTTTNTTTCCVTTTHWQSHCGLRKTELCSIAARKIDTRRSATTW